ncbi:site-specific integrase [Macrococcus capreoli]
MHIREEIDAQGNKRYRFEESYTDPLTLKRKRTSVTFPKHTRATEREASRLLADKINKIVNDKTTKDFKLLTFQEVADEWLEHYKKTSGSKHGTIVHKTSLLRGLKGHVPADVLLYRLDLKFYQDFFFKLHDQGKSNSLLASYLQTIKVIYKYADKYYNFDTPRFIDDITLPKKAVTREELQTKREKYLEKHELKYILSALNTLAESAQQPSSRRNYKTCAYIVEFLALNGMRVGELSALQEDSIDEVNKLLTIDGTISWVTGTSKGSFGVKDTTKTEYSYRRIALSERSLEIIRAVKLMKKQSLAWDAVYDDRGFIFTNSTGNPFKPEYINSMIKDAIKLHNAHPDLPEADKITKKITSHALRHTHISLLAQENVPLKAIMERVGHHDPTTTTAIYTHVTQNMHDKTRVLLENILA